MAHSGAVKSTWSDEEPPLLGEEVDDVPIQISDNLFVGSERSVMDEIISTVTEAKAAKRRVAEKENRSTKGFGAGLKKGFFVSSSVKPKHGPQKSQRLESSTRRREDALQIVTCSTNQGSQSDTTPKTSSLVFPEVQAAIESAQQLNPKDWLNDSFLSKLSENPRLLNALKNPRFMEAMNELQRDPREAVSKYSKDPEISQLLSELMEFLATHFEELGKEEERKQPNDVIPASPPIVDLDMVRRQAIANMERTPEEEEQVQKILKSPDLLAVLSDTKFMDLLRKSQQDPSSFRRLAEDPVMGPKLRLLVEAKMVAFA